MSSTHTRDTIRAIVVVALAIFVLSTSLPDIRRVWLPLGTFGILAADLNQVITGVEPNSPAARAGIKVGDKVLLKSIDPEHRMWLFSGLAPETPVPGQQLTFAVMQNGQPHYVTMTSQPENLTPTTKLLLVLRELALLLFVGIGGALVLLRPSIATWAFYLVCLGLNGAPGQVASLWMGSPWNYVAGALGTTGLLWGTGFVGVIVFAAVFLHDRPSGWRAAIVRLAPFLTFALASCSVYLWIGPGIFGLPGKAIDNASLILQAVYIGIAMSAFIATYVAARGIDRQRIRWVIVGFGFALVTWVIQGYLTSVIALPYWLYASLLLVPVVMPLTVAYAVIKHRVIDVSFVVSRALVYGILTTIIVGAFSVVDWLFVEKLKLVRLGTIAELAVAVAGGFWFNGMHRKVDAFIDATFFRQRHRAEVVLSRDAAALRFAETPETVAHFLVDEPTRALALASAALFRRRRDGVYIREASQGWESDCISRLDANDDPLLLLARTESGPLSLHDHPWRSHGVPTGVGRPILALPVIVRRELAGIVFYGAHAHGEALDPDEVRIIAGLATSSAAAYDHIDAETLRKENEAIRGEVSLLRTQLAETQIQPA